MFTVSRRMSDVVAQVCCLTLLMSMLTASPAHAATKFQPRPLQQTPSVPVRALTAKAPAPDPAAANSRRGAPPSTTLPRAGSVVVDLPAAHTPSATVRSGDLPVSMTAPAGSSPADGTAVARARVETLDQAQAARAGLHGVLLQVSRADGRTTAAPLTLSVQYSSFRNAYGGDWASRLQLLAVPECALTTPNSGACRPVPVSSTNDVAAGQVTAQVLASGQASATAPPTTSKAAGSVTTEAGSAAPATTSAASPSAAAPAALFALVDIGGSS